MNDQYVAGVCNIGTSEANNRTRIGVMGAAVTVVLGAGLLALDTHPALMLLLALPAFVAATGFIQGRTRFCAGYGMSGMSNFGDDRSSVERTELDPELAADKARARRITRNAVLIGLAVALLAVALATVL